MNMKFPFNSTGTCNLAPRPSPSVLPSRSGGTWCGTERWSLGPWIPGLWNGPPWGSWPPYLATTNRRSTTQQTEGEQQQRVNNNKQKFGTTKANNNNNYFLHYWHKIAGFIYAMTFSAYFQFNHMKLLWCHVEKNSILCRKGHKNYLH